MLEKIGVGPERCVDYYPPAKKLVQLGLALFADGKLTITDAGREKLKARGNTRD